MDHNMAAQFNLAVDATSLPRYYGLPCLLPPSLLTFSLDFIRNPLCLNDIRFHLTAGLYQENMHLFYRYPPPLCLCLSPTSLTLFSSVM
jgi:hypothetical protein